MSRRASRVAAQRQSSSYTRFGAVAAPPDSSFESSRQSCRDLSRYSFCHAWTFQDLGNCSQTRPFVNRQSAARDQSIKRRFVYEPRSTSQFRVAASCFLWAKSHDERPIAVTNPYWLTILYDPGDRNVLIAQIWIAPASLGRGNPSDEYRNPSLHLTTDKAGDTSLILSSSLQQVRTELRITRYGCRRAVARKPASEAIRRLSEGMSRRANRR
jgi:hypothetical protein